MNEGNLDNTKKVENITSDFVEIQDINTNYNPSDRIIKTTLVDKKEVFQKHFHGMQIIKQIELGTVLEQNPHLKDWVENLLRCLVS